MLYAILCYNSEAKTTAWTKEQDAAVMARLSAVQDQLKKQGRLGPVARLMPTTAAITLRKDREPPVIVDGPFAETKEQLLGFYLVDCQSREQALDAARDLGRANPGGSYEIRPLATYVPPTVLGQVSRTVRDIAEAEAWYGGVLGLRHLYTFGKLAFFDLGGTRLYLQEGVSAGAESVLYLQVADIRKSHEDLKGRGVEFTEAPHMIHKHGDGMEEWMAFFKDPEGRSLALMSQVKP
jgi:catechol 2,3-dioxygenase-like lactoylglutathione lyase family enzyme